MNNNSDDSMHPYRPQGEGPHPTLAGNILDPGIKADGAMSQSHQGVGATSEKRIREEGLEHVKGQSGIDTSSSSTSGLGSGSMGSSGLGSSTTGYGSGSTSSGTSSALTGHPPASNPSADDASGGIPHGSGGVSSAGHKLSPVSGVVGENESSNNGQGLVGTAMSYLGLSGSRSNEQQPLEARNAEPMLGNESARPLESNMASERGTGISDRSYGEGGAAALGAGALGAGAYEGSRSSGGYTEPLTSEFRSGSTGAGANPMTTGETTSTTRMDNNDPAVDTAAAAPRPTDSDVTTGREPTDSADPTTADGPAAGGEQVSDASIKKHDHDHDSKRENKDAIPTAGGEKLGSRHWGESKVVPENPAKRASEAGVSSAEGQPTDQVRDNVSS